ncbi:MAG: energy transducer TonB [Bacteroidaceae bacterium]|nr:energy transducer TonB [Bacteroidales bacterium]MBO5263129.1 energy transducer TonB [Bacteroidaceae bacterium]MBQ8256644.1 energy transducer TonB [Bacteroidaceae bacterium]
MDTTKRQQGNGSELLEVKKSAHVNLEQHKTTWLLIGYILVFGVLFVAFEWTATEKKHTGEIVSAGILLEEEIMVPITMPEKKVVPPPPQAKQITEILEIVDDEAEIEESELASVEETGEVVEIADVGNVVVEDIPEEEPILQIVEQMPEFPGGMAALMKYLKENINYPRISRENGSQGKAFINFVVNTDGSIQDIEVLRSSSDPYLDKEALRVVGGMPKWNPGKQAGKAVRVRFTLPVTFRLK